jgi:ribosomal protein S18 acetylase RimI-like enzyme
MSQGHAQPCVPKGRSRHIAPDQPGRIIRTKPPRARIIQTWIHIVSQTTISSTSGGEIEVVAASGVDEELIAAFNRLVPQLSRSAVVPPPELIREIVEAQASTVLIARDARDNRRIVGLLTLVVFRIPTGVRAWIEDVVVDEAVRGRGVGEALSQEAVRRAVGLGARTVELTSRPAREAANRLYQRLGFVRRDSNVYRYTP